jgi:hypothetical protein
LWLVNRTDECRYDEYDGIVVRAESEERAITLACGDTDPDVHPSFRRRPLRGFLEDGSNARVTELTIESDEEIILLSFRAG